MSSSKLSLHFIRCVLPETNDSRCAGKSEWKQQRAPFLSDTTKAELKKNNSDFDARNRISNKTLINVCFLLVINRFAFRHEGEVKLRDFFKKENLQRQH